MEASAKPIESLSKPLIATNRWEAIKLTMSNALIITRREVRDSFRDWRILGPIITLTFLFPFLAQVLASSFTDFVQSYGADVIGERTIPFLLMIVGFFPISISLVIALETFVGEKERRSLEPLLSTPLTNTELYIGKTLAAMIPPLVASYGGMFVYLGSLLFGELSWRPASTLVIQIIMLTTVQALVMVTGAVVVSSQTTSTRAANLLASFIIIPMTIIIQGESAIMFLAPDAQSPHGISALWAIIVGMLVVVVLLLRVGNSIFNREELLGRTIDELNLRMTLRSIWRNIRAVDEAQPKPNVARNIIEWYTRSIPLSLRRLRSALLVTVGVFLAAFCIGYFIGQLPQWQLPLPPQTDLMETRPAQQFDDLLTLSLQQKAAGFIFGQNARVLLGTLLLSIFTFGVVALALPPVTFALLGYLMSQIVTAGYDLDFVLAAILTHGIVEIPVIVLASALSLRLGATLTKPPEGMTVGQGWMIAFGDALKLILGVVIPGLIIAALIEAFITPRVVLAVLGG